MYQLKQILLDTITELGPNAYGFIIQEAIEKKTGKPISLTWMYSVLFEMEDDGLVRSWDGEATPERGNRKKRYFERRE